MSNQVIDHAPYRETRWTCPASVVVTGSDGSEVEKYKFSTRNPLISTTAAVTGDLLNYDGVKVGTYSAYNEKVSASDYNYVDDMGTPSGAYISEDGDACTYNNGHFTEDSSGKPTTTVSPDVHDSKSETILPGNLKFTIKRDYTAIDRSAYYIVRAVTDIGEEGGPSDVSTLVTRRPDEKATLSFAAPDSSDDDPSASDNNIKNIAKYRIYRSATGTNGSDFLFVDEIVVDGVNESEFEFSDHKADAELNEPMPAYGKVPEGLGGIVGMSGGFMAAYKEKGKDIYFSEPYMPYAFPWEYSQSVPFEIVGMAVRNNYLYVMTTGPLYAFVGDHPETITPLAMRFDVPCISRKSIAHVRGDIVYAGTTGLVLIGNGGPAVFSDKLYTLEQYKDLHFENCKGAGEYDGKYFAVFEDRVEDRVEYRVLVFDFSDGALHHTILDKTAVECGTYSWNDGSWKDYRENFKDSNTPYGETMITQDFETGNLNAVWQSKDYISGRPIAFTCARVRFKDASNVVVTMKLFAEGEEVFSGEVQHNKAFRLPVLRRECRWSVEIAGAADITSVELAESMTEM